jgi:hypothetical protein
MVFFRIFGAKISEKKKEKEIRKIERTYNSIRVLPKPIINPPYNRGL